jgi:hypothetical protein
MRQTLPVSGMPTVKAGLIGRDATDAVYVDINGTNGTADFCAAAANAEQFGSTWGDLYGYILGTAATGTAGPKHTAGDPAKMHTNTRWYRPIFRVNMTNAAGTIEVDEFRVEMMPRAEESVFTGGGTYINGDYIATGTIDANRIKTSTLAVGTTLTVGNTNAGHILIQGDGTLVSKYSGTEKIKINASGELSAGLGQVILNEDGLYLMSGADTPNRIRWNFTVYQPIGEIYTTYDQLNAVTTGYYSMSTPNSSYLAYAKLEAVATYASQVGYDHRPTAVEVRSQRLASIDQAWVRMTLEGMIIWELSGSGYRLRSDGPRSQGQQYPTTLALVSEDKGHWFGKKGVFVGNIENNESPYIGPSEGNIVFTGVTARRVGSTNFIYANLRLCYPRLLCSYTDMGNSNILHERSSIQWSDGYWIPPDTQALLLRYRLERTTTPGLIYVDFYEGENNGGVLQHKDMGWTNSFSPWTGIVATGQCIVKFDGNGKCCSVINTGGGSGNYELYMIGWLM